jgi:hypothetical protein
VERRFLRCQWFQKFRRFAVHADARADRRGGGELTVRIMLRPTLEKRSPNQQLTIGASIEADTRGSARARSRRM